MLFKIQLTVTKKDFWNRLPDGSQQVYSYEIERDLDQLKHWIRSTGDRTQVLRGENTLVFTNHNQEQVRWQFNGLTCEATE